MTGISFLDDLFSLKDKIALVTGASSGIGRAMALALARAGAAVVHVARGEDALKAVVADVLAGGGQAAYAVGDLCRIEALARLTLIGPNGVFEDLDGLTVFLASSASGYVTGQTIFLDGGWSAK